jgi:MFS family permease
MHGRVDEAEAAVSRIEELTEQTGGALEPVDESKAIEILPADSVGYWALTKTLFRRYPSRSVLGASLMITQSFLYNAIFFTYSLVLTKIYGVSEGNTAYYFMAFALGNLLGPLLLGHLFDTIGRRTMISGTYLISGVALAISAMLFHTGQLSALTQTICWCFIFFFASAGASAAYLTVSEIFPVEVRAKAIAVFFAIAQCFGSFGPWFYGKLIGDTTGQTATYLEHHSKLWIGYLIGAAVMIIGAIVELALGVNAECRSLEDVARPLTAVDVPGEPGGLLSSPTGAPRPPTA